MTKPRSLNDYPKTMITEQVADLLGHPESVVQMWAREGKLPAHKGPGSDRWLFDRDEVIAWIRAHRVVPED